MTWRPAGRVNQIAASAAFAPDFSS